MHPRKGQDVGDHPPITPMVVFSVFKFSFIFTVPHLLLMSKIFSLLDVENRLITTLGGSMII